MPKVQCHFNGSSNTFTQKRVLENAVCRMSVIYADLNALWQIAAFMRRERPKTSTKLSQTGGSTTCSSRGTLTQNCISPVGVAMGMSSNVVNIPVRDGMTARDII